MTNEEDQGPSLNEMRAFAYRLLGRREYSMAELTDRLVRKWPSASGIEHLVTQLAGENLVSDERYAESFIRSRIQRHQGPLKIKAELRHRGIGDALIDEGLRPHSDNWHQLASEWLRGQHAGEFNLDEKQKYYRRLVNRGFTHDQAMSAVNT